MDIKEITKTKESTLDYMRKLSTQINKMELQRRTGDYVSGNEVIKKRKEFAKISKIYKRKFFQL